MTSNQSEGNCISLSIVKWWCSLHLSVWVWCRDCLDATNFWWRKIGSFRYIYHIDICVNVMWVNNGLTRSQIVFQSISFVCKYARCVFLSSISIAATASQGHTTRWSDETQSWVPKLWPRDENGCANKHTSTSITVHFVLCLKMTNLTNIHTCTCFRTKNNFTAYIVKSLQNKMHECIFFASSLHCCMFVHMQAHWVFNLLELDADTVYTYNDRILEHHIRFMAMVQFVDLESRLLCIFGHLHFSLGTFS